MPLCKSGEVRECQKKEEKVFFMSRFMFYFKWRLWNGSRGRQEARQCRYEFLIISYIVCAFTPIPCVASVRSTAPPTPARPVSPLLSAGSFTSSFPMASHPVVPSLSSPSRKGAPTRDQSRFSSQHPVKDTNIPSPSTLMIIPLTMSPTQRTQGRPFSKDIQHFARTEREESATLFPISPSSFPLSSSASVSSFSSLSPPSPLRSTPDPFKLTPSPCPGVSCKENKLVKAPAEEPTNASTDEPLYSFAQAGSSSRGGVQGFPVSSLPGNDTNMLPGSKSPRYANGSVFDVLKPPMFSGNESSDSSPTLLQSFTCEDLDLLGYQCSSSNGSDFLRQNTSSAASEDLPLLSSIRPVDFELLDEETLFELCLLLYNRTGRWEVVCPRLTRGRQGDTPGEGPRVPPRASLAANEWPRILAFSLIFVVGVVGNVLVVVTLLHHRNLRTVTNVFLLNLAVSDLLLGVFCMPFTLVGTILQDFVFGAIMCRLIPYMQGPFTVFPRGVAAFVPLIVMAAAYLRVIRTLWLGDEGQRRCSARQQGVRTVQDISSLTCCPGRSSAPASRFSVRFRKVPSRIWTGEALQHGAAAGSPSPLEHQCRGHDGPPPASPGAMGAAEGSAGEDLGTPPGGRALKKRWWAGGGSSGSQMGSSDSNAWRSLRSSQTERSLLAKRRVIRMLFVLVAEFFICWSPLFIVNLLSLYIPRQVYAVLGSFGVSLVQLVAYLSSCCNPITYCFMNAKFLQSFKQTFGCAHRRSHSFPSGNASSFRSVGGYVQTPLKVGGDSPLTTAGRRRLALQENQRLQTLHASCLQRQHSLLHSPASVNESEPIGNGKLSPKVIETSSL
ncbi:uncharacterized protein LOC119596696 [Penaeus monodon]|uniref:uncharacterized protein LOC119596696 n=1 Tax=Penaeus monodon TaxID=6687 RepID=UPI0018A757FE|nr:uncharacterized protein LOC119596696 [Penaeus monodon]